jgi:hypothetical protein
LENDLYLATRERAARVTALSVVSAVFAVALAPIAYAVGRTLPVRATYSHGDPALAAIAKKPSTAPNGRHIVLTYPTPESARSMIQQARTNNFWLQHRRRLRSQIYTDLSPNREARLLLLALSYDYSPSPEPRGSWPPLVQALQKWQATDYLVPIYLPTFVTHSNTPSRVHSSQS